MTAERYHLVVAFDRDASGEYRQRQPERATSEKAARKRAKELSFSSTGAIAVNGWADPTTGIVTEGQGVAYGDIPPDILKRPVLNSAPIGRAKETRAPRVQRRMDQGDLFATGGAR